MKFYSIFVFLLCVDYKLFSQDFSVFKDKRITSTLNVESNTKPKGEIIQKQNEEVVINPTSSNRMLEREIQIINNEKSTTFLRTITRIKLERSANGRVSIYDSKNPFERDRMADALGIQYDPYIGKTKKTYHYSSAHQNTNDFDDPFERNWNEGIPNFNANTEWSGLFQNLKDRNLILGSKWADSIRTSLSATFINYQVKSIDKSVLTLSINGYTNPINNENKDKPKNDMRITATSSISTFEGEMIVDISTGFVSELTLTKQGGRSIPMMGQTIFVQSSSILKLKNDIKLVKNK